MTIKDIKYDLIQFIMTTTDVASLKSMYDHYASKSNDKLRQVNNINKAIEPPKLEILYNVSLDEIKSNQSIESIKYDEIREMVDSEKFDKSINELLETL